MTHAVVPPNYDDPVCGGVARITTGGVLGDAVSTNAERVSCPECAEHLRTGGQRRFDFAAPGGASGEGA